MKSLTTTLLVLSVCLLACQQPKPNSEINETHDTTATQVTVGADKDEHGCIGSAGYLWSSVRETCVRPWEAGAQFTAYDTKSGGDGVAFVVLSQDFSKAEIFFSGEKPSVLTRVQTPEGDVAPVLFANKDLTVDITYNKDTYLIRKNGEPIYVHPYSATSGLGLVIKP